MSRFEEDTTDVAVIAENISASVADNTQHNPAPALSDDDSDKDERVSLQQQLYRARKAAQRAKRVSAERANPTMRLRGRARAFYAEQDAIVAARRRRQQQATETELARFLELKQQQQNQSSDNEPSSPSSSSSSEEEVVKEAKEIKEEQKHEPLADYSDSD